MIATDPKSIHRRLQQAADQIAISLCDLSDIESIDETVDMLVTEAIPLIVEQVGHMSGLREKLRLEKFGQ